MKSYHIEEEVKVIKKNVMIVDDMSLVRNSFGQVMEQLGFKVQEAKDGKKALELLEKEKVDCILMDLNMPGMDGLQAVKKIRAAKRVYKNIRFLLFQPLPVRPRVKNVFSPG